VLYEEFWSILRQNQRFNENLAANIQGKQGREMGKELSTVRHTEAIRRSHLEEENVL